MRGDDCNTDHKMLRVKVILGKKRLFGSECARRWWEEVEHCKMEVWRREEGR